MSGREKEEAREAGGGRRKEGENGEMQRRVEGARSCMRAGVGVGVGVCVSFQVTPGRSSSLRQVGWDVFTYCIHFKGTNSPRTHYMWN